MYIALIFYSITSECKYLCISGEHNGKEFYIIFMITNILTIIINFIIKPISKFDIENRTFNVLFTIFYHCIHFIVEGLLYTKINIHYYNVLLGLRNLLRNDFV